MLLLTVVVPTGEAQTTSEGKVISAQGKVEYLPVQAAAWAPAKILQDLFVQDRVHTLSRSRASILFKDETQVRLNANAELAVRSLSDRKGGSSVMELFQGEGWFRTKNPSSDLHVATPSATAAIRGTEINIRIAGPDETVLTVVEGNVNFSNDQGSITVSSGEEATARKGEAPTKRLILSPEDAVQWVISYPLEVSWHDLLANSMNDAVRAGFLSLKEGNAQAALDALLPLAGTDPWARVGASMAYVDLADSADAAAILGGPLQGSLEAERQCQLAVVSLSTGDVVSARAALDSARALAPDSPRIAMLAATVELVRNNKEKAKEISQAAVTAHPESVSANITAGQVAQAFFDLPLALRYLDAARSIDPDDIRVLVNRSRVLFGMGRAEEAAADVGRASRLAPDDPQVRSLRGFILLSRGELAPATVEFQAAMSADSSFGEPHLGAGLLAFKQGKADEGLWELLAATLLDPKIALYQSYLGKAYYQLQRFPEGLAALDSAVRLDSKDPTPHLYKSHFLRDLNRHVDALEELNIAIALNDNRAVYRSRLLLDQDRATKNVSLARTYHDVGLDAWGVSNALTSLNSDFTNASAHLFLADLYGNLPDRLQAQESEFLQYILFSPVNQNSFASFNEYTSLFEQPKFSFSGFVDGEYPEYGALSYPSFYVSNDLSTRSGNDSFSHVSLLRYKFQEGARPGKPDQIGLFDLIAKAAFGISSNAFLHTTVSLSDRGAFEGNITLLQSSPYAVNVQTLGAPVDPKVTSQDLMVNVAVGARHDWVPGFPLMAVFQFEYIKYLLLTPDMSSSVSGVLLNDTTRVDLSLLDFETQQVFTLGDRFQLLAGADAFLGNWHNNDSWSAYYQASGLPYGTTGGGTTDSSETGIHGWIWNEFQLLESLHLSAVGFYKTDHGKNLVDPSVVYDYAQFYPAVGLTFTLGPGLVVRAAAFQFRTSRLFPQTIYPCSIAGFLLDRNEDIYTFRTEAHLSIDNLFEPVFISNHVYYRESVYPPSSAILLSKAQTIGFTSDLNWKISKNFCASAKNDLDATATPPFMAITDQITTAVTFTVPAGLTLTLSNSYIIQQFPRSVFTELTGSNVDLLEGKLHFEFPAKHGYLEISVTNALDQRFTLFTEGLAIADIFPYRKLTATVHWIL
jgi:tetratricopeptide (TPR) repeat protein